ncbi:hypothetical protein C10C_0645 [Chlamydia serpentis]|uniref:Uncharacterized protein n=1 Tax=Chlamydia serpentis TaxID=1967782 RepID=A0A2R8FBL5_9CHLA|nr:hypothetical protein [Chlamydia serpentis]SPN73798.1 hypothetical protein C10C_0645 [Chlamydia serpentis]
MAINPSGRKSNDDFWLGKSEQEGSQSSEINSHSNSNLGRHNVSRSSTDTNSQGSVSELRKKLARHFGAGGLLGSRGSAQYSTPLVTQSPARGHVSIPESSEIGGARPKVRSGASPKPKVPPRPISLPRPSDAAPVPQLTPKLQELVGTVKQVSQQQAKKEKRLSKLSEKIKSRWIAWETTFPVDYQQHAYNVLRQTLLIARDQQRGNIKKKSKSSPRLVKASLETINNVVQQALYNATTFKISEVRNGAELQLVCVLALEGPLLVSQESIERFLRGRASDLGIDNSNSEIEELIRLLGQSIDSVRNNHPGQMPIVWEYLTSLVLDAVINMKAKTAVYNVGKVNRDNVDSMTRYSEQKLNDMRNLSESVWCNTMTILISDLFNYGDS